MAIGFLLNKGQQELAKAEVDALVDARGVMIGDYYVVAVPYKESYNLLAFTKTIYSVKVIGHELAGKMMLVDLNKINQFQQRRAHLLPSGHPAMTHPRLARAMVNLSAAEKEICDPFCGGGGILIEAGLCGLHVVGFDIDRIMLKRSQMNLDEFNLTNYQLKLQDATTFSGAYEAVVTDLPYGKNTKVTGNLENLYLSFLRNVKKNNIKKIVVGFPDFVNYKAIIARAKFTIKEEFDYYLHRSLSKKIVVIQ